MKLYQHQIDAIERGKGGNVAMFHDCGTGKTLTAIKLIDYWRSQGEGPALVVCPLSVIDTAWMEDVRKFAPHLKAVPLWSKKPAERARRLLQEADVYIANFETFKSLYPSLSNKGFKVLIVDESSKMKDHSTAITKALLATAGIRCRGSKFAPMEIPHRYCLSGTPAPNDESEYWSQIKLITGPTNEGFHQNFFVFRSHYFNGIQLGSTRMRMWQFRKAMQEEFMEAMKPYVHIVRKADALDLPEQVHEIRHVDLSPEERKAYDTLRREYVLQFANEAVLASTALVEVMKLRQLTSGFCYGMAGTHQTGTSKLRELKDLLAELGGNQVIIWANFRHEIAELLKALPNSEALWSDTVDRDAVISRFQNGQSQYLIANPQSAAHGLTFVNCSYAVYFSLNYSYELQKQSQDRIHRIGQGSKCTYFYLVARNTVDEVIYKAVANKAKLSDQILAYLKDGNDGRTGAKDSKLDLAVSA